MRVLIQRSQSSKVTVSGKVTGKIDNGLVLLVGFTEGDSINEIKYMINKIINLRIFDDENKVMNKSLLDTKGSVLSISQFTLYADTTKGKRPSYAKALNSKDASKLYDLFNEQLSKYVKVQTGVFGADMKVSILNDGPVTIYLEKEANHDKK